MTEELIVADDGKVEEVKERYFNYFSCPHCFFTWVVESSEESSDKEKLCDFCENHTNMDGWELSERRLEVMLTAHVSNFTKTLSGIFNLIKELRDRK